MIDSLKKKSNSGDDYKSHWTACCPHYGKYITSSKKRKIEIKSNIKGWEYINLFLGVETQNSFNGSEKMHMR